MIYVIMPYLWMTVMAVTAVSVILTSSKKGAVTFIPAAVAFISSIVNIRPYLQTLVFAAVVILYSVAKKVFVKLSAVSSTDEYAPFFGKRVLVIRGLDPFSPDGVIKYKNQLFYARSDDDGIDEGRVALIVGYEEGAFLCVADEY